MELYKNKLIDKILVRNFKTWEHTLDTGDYVDAKFAKKIDRFIFNNLNRQFKEADIYYLLYLKYQGIKLGIFQCLKIWWSGIESKYRVLHSAEYEKFKLSKQKVSKSKN